MQRLEVGAHLKFSLGGIKEMWYLEEREDARSKEGAVPGNHLSFSRKVVNCPQTNLCHLRES